VDRALSEAPSRPIELRHASTDRPNVVVVPERRFLAIDGTGHPGASGFRLATAALRAAHAAVRKSIPHDRFAAGPRTILEIVWFTDPSWSLDELLRVLGERDTVRWREMLELPSEATASVIADAIAASTAESGGHGPVPSLVVVTEGRAVQMLQVGPTTDLSPTVASLHRFIAAAGWRPRGGIHQLVFADPDVVPSSRARSIVRVPIEEAMRT
jgi:hypothetical protein